MMTWLMNPWTVRLAIGACCVLLGARNPCRNLQPLRVPARFQPIADPNLPNAIRVHPQVISGGTPKGQTGFEALRRLGVQTVVSVDGVAPDVRSASDYGLQYVHLPHGYDGIPHRTLRHLAAVVSRRPGPVYIHCHHGRHRSPAAAAVACIATGLLHQESGVDVLRAAGTDTDYGGLYRAVAKAVPLSAQQIRELPDKLPVTAPVPPVIESMVAMDRILEQLEAGRTSATSRTNERAVLLREHFAELRRQATAENRPAGFQALAREGYDAATKLAQSSDSAPGLAAELRNVRRNCTDCHKAFRNGN